MINDIVLQRLKEREKELNTLYRLNSLLSDQDLSADVLFRELIRFVPLGFQYTTICEIRVLFDGQEWKTDDYRETPWMLKADVVIDNSISGEIRVVYTQLIQEHKGGQFYPEEQRLINTIADRIGNYIFQQRLRNSLRLLDTGKTNGTAVEGDAGVLGAESDQHWKWRFRMAERISELMEMRRLGVKAVYIIGSTKNASAGPASDIDLLIHHEADEQQLNCLKAWLDGWSKCLAEENFQRTGYPSEGLIDLHLVTDSDIARQTSFAVMIGAVNDPARLLRKIDL